MDNRHTFVLDIVSLTDPEILYTKRGFTPDKIATSLNNWRKRDPGLMYRIFGGKKLPPTFTTEWVEQYLAEIGIDIKAPVFRAFVEPTAHEGVTYRDPVPGIPKPKQKKYRYTYNRITLPELLVYTVIVAILTWYALQGILVQVLGG
jgi:hypothetical protein